MSERQSTVPARPRTRPVKVVLSIAGAVAVLALGIVLADRLFDETPETAPLIPGGGPDRATPSNGTPEPVARIFQPDPGTAAGLSDADGVAGRVLDPDGNPLAAAEVILLRLTSPWPEERAEELAHVFSGSDGTFRFATRRDVDLALEVVHAGMARQRISSPKELRSIDVRLEPGFDVAGVVRAAGGGPLGQRGVPVHLEPGAFGTRRTMTTRSDVNGRFLFTNVSAGAARVTVRVPGFAPASVSSVNVGGGPIGVTPDYVGFGLKGIVRRASDGSLVEGAEVRLYPGTAWNALLYEPVRATSDRDGDFRIRELASGPATVVVSHPDHSTLIRAINVADGQLQQEFELGRRSTVRVRLSGALTRGLELRLETGGQELHRATQSDAGLVEFEGAVGTGNATLEIIDGTRAFADSSSRATDVTIDDVAETEIALELVEPSKVVGRVVDDQGRPLEGVLIATRRRLRFLQAQDPRAWYAATDQDGRFELHGLGPGKPALRFSREGWAVTTVVAEIDAAGVRVDLGEVKLERPGTIRGVIKWGDAPQAGARVFASREGQTGLEAVSGTDGGYALYGLAPGRYRILARSGSSPLQVHAELVTVESGRETTSIDLVLPPGRRIHGQVTGSAGVPVPEALICVVGSTAAVASTDQNGRFDVEVPPGDVELQAFAPDFRSTTTEVIGATGRFVTMRLPFVPQGGVDARVSAAARGRLPQRVIVGVTLLDAAVETDPVVRRLSTKRIAVDLSPSGRLSADQLPAGRARLEILAPGHGVWRADVEIAQMGRIDIGNVKLEPGAELRGRVTDDQGKPIAGAIVHLGEADDLMLDLARQNRSDADGHFTVRGITPIGRRIVVAADGYTTVVRDLALPDDLLRREPYAVRLDPSSVIHVQLVQGGAPAAAFRVLAIHYEGQFIATRTTGLDGSLDFVADRPGRYRIGIFGAHDDEGLDVVVGESAARLTLELAIGK